MTHTNTTIELTKKQAELLLTKKGELKYDYKYLSLCPVMHHSQWIRSKGFHNLKSDYFKITQLLKAFGVKWSEGNDAPKGGKEGDYIKIRKSTAEKINAILEGLK